MHRESANQLPASAGTTTKDMLGFFLFWLISLPAIWFPIHQMYVRPPLTSCKRLKLTGFSAATSSP